MSDRCTCNSCQCESPDSVCIQTNKVYDSCRDKECIENIRVYLTESAQCMVDRAANVKCRKSEIIWVYTDVEPLPFNRGYYSVDLRFFFRITLDVFTGVSRPAVVEGLAVYDKKVILFGSEGNSRTFYSKSVFGEADVHQWNKTNLPVAQTEVCVSFLAVQKYYLIHREKTPFIITQKRLKHLTFSLFHYTIYLYNYIQIQVLYICIL